MKVLQINTVCGTGSTGKIATDLYDVLIKDGHECCIAYGRGKAQKDYDTIKIGNDLETYLHVLKTRLFDLHGFGSKKATQNFIKEIENYNPDVIHLHNLHGYYLNIEVLFNYLSTLSIPIVWLLHDQWSISGHSAYFNLDKSDNIPDKNLTRKQIKDYPKSIFINNSAKNYREKRKLFTSIQNMTIITPSNWLAKIVRKSFLSKYDIQVINNGIDLDKFKPTKTNLRNKYKLENKKIILGVANIWEERKGLKYFNKLAEMLSDDYKVILVGVNQKSKEHISSKIMCISRTKNVEELASIYTEADIFLNPTLQDNFPTTNIESLACGTPVITFNIGGSPESLTSITGKVLETTSIYELFNTINNFNYKDYKSDNCIKQSKLFNKEKIYMKYIALYKDLVEKN